MRILLTNPTLHYSHGHKFIQPDWPSLTLPYLAAIVGDHDMRIVDNSYKKSYFGFWCEYHRFKPDLVAFSVIAGRDAPSVLAVTENIHKTKIIAGGQGAINMVKYVDVFLDEAERALPYYLETGINKKFNRIKLDDSPIPRWDLVPKIKSRIFDTYTGAMEMSRGCPHRCNFCSIASFWHSYRAKSNKRILKELQYLSARDRRHIYLSDDSFGINPDKHMDLFDMILRSELKLKFFTQIRADTVANHPHMIALAKRAGLYGVLVGFDSYESGLLMGNGKTTTEEINNEASRVLRENKIAIFGSHIYGLPGQISFKKTFRVGRKNSDLFAMPYFDGRPRVDRPGYDARYARYVRRDLFSIKTLLNLLNPNRAIRELTRGGVRRWWNCSRGYKRDA